MGAASSAATLPSSLVRHDRLEAIWRVTDPKFTLASVAALLLGACVAARDGALSWGWLAVTVLGTFCVEAAKNASGEIFDWDSGTDPGIREDERTPFSGGKRVLVDGLVTRRELAIIAACFYALGAVAGLAVVLLQEPRVIWIGLSGFALAFFYHAPPLKLAYRGLGELAIGAAYGPVVACGTYLVQRHVISPGILIASLPLLFAQLTCITYCEFPDSRSDAIAGKRTWVVRLGRSRAARAYPWLVALAYASVLVLPLFGFSEAVWAGLCGLPFALRAAIQLGRFHDTPRKLTLAFPFVLASFMLQAVGIGMGVLLGGH
jgi:1,4-dihydroxy-2-naphthoate octaprenyltransferase